MSHRFSNMGRAAPPQKKTNCAKQKVEHPAQKRHSQSKPPCLLGKRCFGKQTLSAYFRNAITTSLVCGPCAAARAFCRGGSCYHTCFPVGDVWQFEGSGRPISEFRRACLALQAENILQQYTPRKSFLVLRSQQTHQPTNHGAKQRFCAISGKRKENN